MSSEGKATGARSRRPTLLAAGGAAWERSALEAIAAGGSRVALVKRCLDLTDLLATAATGVAEVAVVSDQLPGLDADSVERLSRHGVRTVAVSGPGPRRGEDDQPAVRDRLLRMGVARVVDEESVPQLAAHVLDACREAPQRTSVLSPRSVPDGAPAEPLPVDATAGSRRGRLLTVGGTGGAPGRTTLAIGLAAEAAARGLRVSLVDADPHGGAVAQHLAVLEESSGLLAAARLANNGRLDGARLAQLAREVVPGLRLVTGLPRPDRWTEVRPQGFTELLEVARALDDLVVVDCGFGVPERDDDPFAERQSRDQITAAALAAADTVVLVGSPDPVGLTRLARSLPELLDAAPGRRHVAVNRMRASLGWSERQVRDLLEAVVPETPVRFLPDDPAAADRALVTGRTLLQCGDSALRRAIAALADAVLPVAAARATAVPRRRLRLPGTVPATSAQTVSSR